MSTLRLALLLLGTLAAPSVTRAQVGDHNGWPAIPSHDVWPSAPLLVASPRDTANVYYRDIAAVRFIKDAVSDSGRALLNRFHAVVIGGRSGYDGASAEYFIRLPDPGESWDAYQASLESLRQEPLVERVTGISYRLRLDIR